MGVALQNFPTSDHHFYTHDLVALKPFVQLIGRVVASSARKAADRQIDRLTKYRNPRSAYAPRVNEGCSMCYGHEQVITDCIIIYLRLIVL